MTLKRFSVLAAVLLAAVVFSGCAPKELLRPKQADIDAFLQANPDLPAVDQSCIDDGRFEIGMLASTVRFLLGEPNSIEQVRQPWASQEHWMYGKAKGKGKKRLFYIEGKHVVGIDEK
ncbi:MAG: hypothetical protein FWC23_04280 [Chitinispirillia bacterium]|nr:hypothetical protein [Chitinispirillia bacterium]MCL2268384.1 hypothetical protein [Chitinispirillia bacterium]